MQRAKYFYPEKSISSVQDRAVNVSTCQLELSASLGPRAIEIRKLDSVACFKKNMFSKIFKEQQCLHHFII